jgi:hypothetical protein
MLGADWEVKSHTDPHLTFTPTNSSLFNDFFFRGQLNGQGNAVGNVSVSVTDNAGITFSGAGFNFSNQANQDFASFGVLSLDGETIRSVTISSTGGFKEVKQLAWFVSSAPKSEMG